MKTKYFITVCLLLIAFTITKAQSREEKSKRFSHTMGTYTDTRDGTVYKTITFIRMHHDVQIKRTWYAENNDFKVAGSKTYSDNKDYAGSFGRLYNYEQSNLACPEGWHVPTIYEWRHLFNFFGGWNHSGKYLGKGKGSDMNMLFGGFGQPSGDYKGIGVHGNWWDNELKDSNSAGIVTLKKEDEVIYHSKVGDKYFLSCRCVKFHN